MITPVTIDYARTVAITDDELLKHMNGLYTWTTHKNRWPVIAAGIHVIKSHCVGAIVEIRKDHITVTPYVGDLLGAMFPLSFILYKSEMMDHVRAVAKSIQGYISSSQSTKND